MSCNNLLMINAGLCYGLFTSAIELYMSCVCVFTKKVSAVGEEGHPASAQFFLAAINFPASTAHLNQI